MRRTLGLMSLLLAAPLIAGATADQRFVVSIADALHGEAQIVKFKCTVQGGTITGFPQIPAHWVVNVQNADIGTWVDAQNVTGNGLTDAGFFHSFMTVAKDAAPAGKSEDFDVSCVVGTYSGLDRENSQFRLKYYGMKDLVLAPVTEAAK